MNFIQNTSQFRRHSSLPLPSPLSLHPLQINSSHDCCTQLLSAAMQASLASSVMSTLITSRPRAEAPKRERKKLLLQHMATRGRTNKYQKYMNVACERENCFISLLSTVKILQEYDRICANCHWLTNLCYLHH